MCSLPISVAIVTPGAFPIPSEMSSSVEQVVQKTAAPLAKRMTVQILGRKTRFQQSREVKDGVRYIRVRYIRPFSYIKEASMQVAKLKPTYIQVENRPRFVRYLRRRYPKKKISLILHSTYFISRPHIAVRELAVCLRAADVIVVNSDFLKKTLERKVPSCAHKIVTQHLGVDVEHFTSRWTPQGAEARQQRLKALGYENRQIILFVGRLIPRKGVHHLLNAMTQVIGAHPEALLLVIGGAFYGSKRKTVYVRRLHKRGRLMPNHVRFIPYVAHADVAKWYQIADIVVVPSAPNEAFGLVNVEAMATGVPVIATRSGGIQEVVADGTTGYLMDPQRIAQELPRYLLRLLGDAELRQVMGEQGNQRVRQLFTWERAAELRHELYVNMLKRN
ncbi:glycosyltransferase family 4 protein [Paenibacillus aestuarii]|uniref:Glycosyltransferase family 4 protein n=1 Tax=Paenibacillus aestuarii TaxID=516965 RepID=A0ABW0K3Y4_9BACL|nr:glycosyltransferase family 4 protein [Paenibacillus aestuarii]